MSLPPPSRPNTFVPPFVGPRLKVRRARKHIAELRDLLLADQAKFTRQEAKLAAVLRERPDLARMPGMFTIIPTKSPPEFPLIVGDVFHNLRTALDIAVSDVTRVNGSDGRQVKFPFAEDANKLEEKLSSKELRGLGPEIIDLLRAMKPFKRGNIPLRGIHDLDIDDKHKFILPAVFQYTVGPSQIYPTWRGDPASPFHLVVILPSPFAGEPFKILEGLAQLTLGIVDTIAEACGLDPPAALYVKTAASGWRAPEVEHPAGVEELIVRPIGHVLSSTFEGSHIFGSFT